MRDNTINFRHPGTQPILSIIVPVLNEADFLPQLCEDLAACREEADYLIECIFVDGGSDDGSLESCPEAWIRKFQSRPGRGQQLAFGATHASGEVLLFLHADCRLSSAHCNQAVDSVRENKLAAGGFHLKFDRRHPVLRFAERVNKLRFRITKVFYGDHGIFVSHEKYLTVGGIPEQPLFEDIEFSRKLRRLGTVKLFNPPIVTSARRFMAGGVIRTFLLMAFMHFLYWLRTSPNVLSRIYNFRKPQAPVPTSGGLKSPEGKKDK